MSQPTRIGGAVKLFGDGLKEICHDSSGFGYGEVAEHDGQVKNVFRGQDFLFVRRREFRF